MEWIKLASFPNFSQSPSAPIRVNHKEFARCSGKLNTKHIHKYNIDDDKWSKWIKYPDDETLDVYQPKMAIDQQRQILYLHFSTRMMVWSFSKNEWKIYKQYKQSFNIGHSAEALVINDEFNIIHGLHNNKHLIWNNKDKIFKTIHQFDGILDSVYFRLIHLKSKGVLLQSTDFSLNITDDIYLYNIMDKKWTKLSNKLPQKMCDFGCVVTRCNKYIIIFGGTYNDKDMDNDIIYILDVNTMTFRKSGIVCPEKGCFHAINMTDSDRDSLATFGYIRRLWNFPEFSNILYPPFYLTNMIGSYYSNEWIYLLNKNGTNWKIQLDVILNDS